MNPSWSVFGLQSPTLYVLLPSYPWLHVPTLHKRERGVCEYELEMEIFLFSSQLYSEHLELCLAQSRCSINIYWANECISHRFCEFTEDSGEWYHKRMLMNKGRFLLFGKNYICREWIGCVTHSWLGIQSWAATTWFYVYPDCFAGQACSARRYSEIM